MAEGKIKWFDPKNRYGHIARQGDRDIFIHINQWRGQGVPQEGQAVTFEEGIGPNGKTEAQNVTPIRAVQITATERPTRREASRASRGESYPHGYRFLNPYNFVRFLPEPTIDETTPVESRLMGRCPPPPHDRWVGLSGRIECHAEAVTPVFVSDSEGVTGAEHKTYQFFNVGGKKMIPASSLRGSVRSVFEAITNSCLATFDDKKRLSYRLDTRDARRLVPARIEKQDEQWVLRLLPGTAELNAEYPPKELYAASVREYQARKPTGRKKIGPPYPAVSLKVLGGSQTGEINKYGSAQAWHGKECYAVLIKVKFPPSWRVLEVFSATEKGERDALARRAELSRQSQGPFEVRRGWLCLTNQNADNKHSERFFFADRKSKFVHLPDDMRHNYEDLIKDYQDRHARAVSKREKPGLAEGEDIAYSRFVLNSEERTLNEEGGELVYALLRGRDPNLQVLFIAPVSIPRAAYNHTIGELLDNDKHMRRCDSEEALCPACRIFGWVRGQEKQEGAYASRVHFSHGHLEKGNPLDAMRLAILGSPKPTTTRFYLTQPGGQPSKGQEDEAIGYDGHNGHNRLRGRKFYRFYQPDYGPESRQLHVDEQSDQNRTIRDPEGVGATFTFSVAFENLAPAELGALLWALEIGGKGYHRLGYGKPLGLGSLSVTVTKLKLRNVYARYTSLDDNGWRKQSAKEDRDYWVSLFQKGMAWPYASEAVRQAADKQGAAAWEVVFGDLPNIKDLLALIGRKEPSLPVHYPLSPDPDTQGQFEWFVGNKRLKGPKLELALAIEDEGLPLIKKDGSLW